MEYRFRPHLRSAIWRAMWIGSGCASIFGLGYILSLPVTGKTVTGPGMLAALYGAVALGVCVSAAMEWAAARRWWIRLTDEGVSRHSPLRNWNVLWSDITGWTLAAPSDLMARAPLGFFIRGRKRAIDPWLGTQQLLLITSSGLLDVGLVERIRNGESLIAELEARLGPARTPRAQDGRGGAAG